MTPDDNVKVYEKLSEITGLKFKAQFKDCGILFERIFEMTDLITGDKNFLLYLDSSTIWFSDNIEFIDEFLLFLNKSIKDLEIEYKTVSDSGMDANWKYLENDRIGNSEYKQHKLLEKFQKFKKEISEQNLEK